MNRALDHIKQEISTLRPVERFDLWRDLGAEFDPPMLPGEDAASIEAAWDEEIAARVDQLEEGKIAVISSEDADSQTAAFFAELGIKHRPA